MKIAVRYYSRRGNTKLLADSIATSAGISAVSIDNERANFLKDVDLLFIGGALYAYRINKNLKSYIESLDSEKIKKAVVFSTSFISKHAIKVIRKLLEEKGITVMDEYIYKRGKLSDDDIKDVKNTASEIIRKCK